MTGNEAISTEVIPVGVRSFNSSKVQMSRSSLKLEHMKLSLLFFIILQGKRQVC